MKKFFLTSAAVTLLSLMLTLVLLILIQSCTDKRAGVAEESVPSYLQNTVPTPNINPDAYDNTRGYWEDGKLITEFDCPDSRFFIPIDLKSWDKTPAINGRLATYAETMDGTAIHHYGEKVNPDVRPYNMKLPKLAYHYNRSLKLNELVVVVQVVQTAKDTVVGYRYLTGGCGGSRFSDYHFLTDEEVRKVVSQ